jgi:hypothetical protein
MTANRKFARLIGGSTISFRQASSPEFTEFAVYLNANYRHPSRQTLVNNICKEAESVAELFKNVISNAPKVIF